MEYRKVVEDDLDRMRKATDFMEMMFNPLIMLDNLDCSKAGFHRNLEHGRTRGRADDQTLIHRQWFIELAWETP